MGEPGHDSQLSRRGQGLSISDLESLLNLQRRDEFEDIFDLERRDDDFFDFERRDSDILSDLSMSQREETAVEKTGECKEEGLWNCIEESKFQTCSSGTWVELKNVVMGTKCANGLGLGLYITAV